MLIFNHLCISLKLFSEFHCNSPLCVVYLQCPKNKTVQDEPNVKRKKEYEDPEDRETR